MDDEVFHEKALIQQAQNGDAESMGKLIAKHEPLIRSMALRVCSGTEKDSLVQAGRLGMIQAVQHYQCAKRVKLITYAVPWIFGEMKRALRYEVVPSAEFSFEQRLGTEEDCLIEHIADREDIDLQRIDLHIAFGMLNEDEQRLLLLRYYRGKTQKETAAIMKRSQTQISRLESHVLDTLRLQLS